ncbi:hypothetical protein BY996DRAFT_6604505 [Phakopsora pachyrhizi]|nr:hypothetical protein BY996DRAFT_6604505 [Phakopsora pachyrhizi]
MNLTNLDCTERRREHAAVGGVIIVPGWLNPEIQLLTWLMRGITVAGLWMREDTVDVLMELSVAQVVSPSAGVKNDSLRFIPRTQREEAVSSWTEADEKNKLQKKGKDEGRCINSGLKQHQWHKTDEMLETVEETDEGWIQTDRADEL